MEVLHVAVGAFVMQLFPLYIVLQVALPWRWRGNWRRAALAPLAVYIPLFVHAAVALMAGSNLWPLLLILTAPLAALYLLGLIVLKYRMEARAKAL